MPVPCCCHVACVAAGAKSCCMYLRLLHVALTVLFITVVWHDETHHTCNHWSWVNEGCSKAALPTPITSCGIPKNTVLAVPLLHLHTKP